MEDLTFTTRYTRVIPRDLFNEAKLLKCIGRLCLLIHDQLTPVPMKFIEIGAPFKIAQVNDGSLTVTNIRITINGDPYLFKTPVNDKSNYPLYVWDNENYVEWLVFDDQGNFSKEFVEFVKTI